MVGGSSRIPYLKERLTDIFSDTEISGDINPDEAIAYGATIQSAILLGVDDDLINNIIITDVTSLSIGIETVGGLCRTIVNKNTIIPCKNSHTFTTFYDDQPAVSIKIFEGERILTKDNHILGKFLLEGIKPASKGKPRINVSFEVNAEGILTVTATDEDDGNSYSITIKYDDIKTKDTEINKSIDDAKLNKEYDINEREKVRRRLRNLYELSVLKKQLPQLSDEVREEFSYDVEDLENWFYKNTDSSEDDIKDHEDILKGLYEDIAYMHNNG